MPTAPSADQPNEDQLCFIYRLKPGCGLEYDRLHAGVLPEIRQRIRSRGNHDYSIFRRGDLVISVLRRGPATDEDLSGTDELQRLWSATLAPLFESIADPQGQPLVAALVFRQD